MKLFTGKHFIWLAICGLGIMLGLFIAKERRIGLRDAGLFMSVVSILSEACKMMTHMIPSPMGGMALDPNAMPFHLCSMQIFVVFYITFAKQSSVKEKVKSFFVPTALLGGILAMLIPTDGVDFWTLWHINASFFMLHWFGFLCTSFVQSKWIWAKSVGKESHDPALPYGYHDLRKWRTLFL